MLHNAKQKLCAAQGLLRDMDHFKLDTVTLLMCRVQSGMISLCMQQLLLYICMATALCPRIINSVIGNTIASQDRSQLGAHMAKQGVLAQCHSTAWCAANSILHTPS